ncbi:hypothetical protein BDV32DRAFT_39883 [Aspergillus pseudonomiae]|nr:hypothetical protein BDV32DRAFT_39883 [Aspergillus pseudonomiae]
MIVKANIFAESSAAPEHRGLPVLGVPTTVLIQQSHIPHTIGRLRQKTWEYIMELRKDCRYKVGYGN